MGTSLSARRRADARALTGSIAARYDELLRAAFPGASAGLTPNEYNQLIRDKDRALSAGSRVQPISGGQAALGLPCAQAEYDICRGRGEDLGAPAPIPVD
jgi:hypothetical protein